MHRFVALTSLALIASALPAQSTTARPDAGGSRAVIDTRAVITTEELRRDLYAFAADSFMGRASGTAEGRKADEFIARRLAALGVEPAGDTGYFQSVPLARTGVASATFAVTRPGGSVAIPFGAMVPLPSFGPGAPRPRLSADGEVVFAGYGAASPVMGPAEREALGDVRGKIVVVVHGAPSDADSARRAELVSEPAFAMRVRNLLELEPSAIVVVIAGGTLAEQFPALVSEIREGVTTLGAATPREESPRELPMVLLTTPEHATPLLPAGWPAAGRVGPVAGHRLRAVVEMHPPTVHARNVIGVIRGSDPALAGSYVAVGAHHDHIGLQTPVSGDSIANGADDNGSGTVALLAVARALTQGTAKPKRSVLFVWHTAEELGLYGSQWFTTHPTVPLDSIVAQINADMIGRNAPDSLYIVGPAAAPRAQSQRLGAMIDSVNASLPRPFLFNREWDSPTHPEQIYYRSDHYNYARRGIPIVFLTTGLHEDYHKVSDVPARVDYEKLSRVADLIYRSTLAVANSPESPRPPRVTP